jgi:hypothetical protein
MEFEGGVLKPLKLIGRVIEGLPVFPHYTPCSMLIGWKVQ